MEPTEDENRPPTSQPQPLPLVPMPAAPMPADQSGMPAQPGWGQQSASQGAGPYPTQHLQFPPPSPSRLQSRLPRAQALAFVQRLKRGTLWVSLAGFAALVGLAASHVTGITAAQSTSPSIQSSHSGDDSSENHDGGFFGDPGNNGNSGSFGSSGSQAPVSGSSVS